MIETGLKSLGVLAYLREVLGGMKRGRSALKLCPRCGSPKLRLYTSLYIGLTPVQYVCERCGYKGPVVMEVQKEASQDQDV